MTDFLKAYPFVSLDDYMWKMNPCLIKLMIIDNTRIRYISDKSKKTKRVNGNDLSSLKNDLGVLIFDKKKEV